MTNIKNIEWLGTQCKIQLDENVEDKILSNIESNNDFEKKDSHYIYDNKPDTLFFEQEYILENKNSFQKITKKLKIKNYNYPLKVFNSKDLLFDSEIDYSKENSIYNEVLHENIFDTNYNISDFNISINMINDYDKEHNLSKIKDIYILLFLANKTKIVNDTFTFVFQNAKTREYNDLKISLNEDNNNEFNNLFGLYSWIMNENNYERSHIIKIEIIRNILSTKIKSSDLVISEAKDAFNIIISNKTGDFFELRNKLVNEYMNYANQMDNILGKSTLQFLGWFTSLSIYIFNTISSNENSNKNVFYLLFFDNSEQVKTIYSLLAFAIIFILAYFYINKKNIIKRYTNLKNFYETEYSLTELTNSPLFTSKTQNYIANGYISFLIIILLLLIFRITNDVVLFN